MANNVAKAQREAAKSPELTGTVAAVESWPLTSPRGRDLAHAESRRAG